MRHVSFRPTVLALAACAGLACAADGSGLTRPGQPVTIASGAEGPGAPGATATAPGGAGAGVEVESDVPVRVDDLQRVPVSAKRMNDFVYRIEGEGAFFLINTSEGSVLVDTGTPYPEQSDAQMALVRKLATGPIRKIVVTHAHNDHSGGLPRFREAIEAGEIEFVGHHRYGYMARLQSDLLPFFKHRYHVLYPTRVDLGAEPPRPYWEMRPTREVWPGADYRFTLGGVEFVVIAPENGGEGEDGVLVWLPESRILFTGDLFGTLYPMFPNLYTVRGEKVRDPLDYIDALDRVLALEPRTIAHSHFRNVEGEAYIQASVTRMRDAVQYVWDETVAGMNAGESLWTLMRDIELPPHLALSQGHGKVSWAVRAIWELVTGWYDYETVANLYHVPPKAVHDDLVELAGGAEALASRAGRYLAEDRPLEAIRLLDIARGHETPTVWRLRIDAVERLLAEARAGLGNYSEIGLLEADLRTSRQALAEAGEASGGAAR